MISDLIFGDAFDGTTQFVAFLLRVAISIFIATSGIEAFLISREIANRRFTWFFYKVAVTLGVFMVSRIIADLADRVFNSTFDDRRPIAWFSLEVNCIFWGLIYYRVRAARRNLQRNVQRPTIERFSQSYDDLIFEMSASKAKATAKLRELGG